MRGVQTVHGTKEVTPSAMDPLRDQLQQTLGHTHRLDRELGGGGMSRVFLST